MQCGCLVFEWKENENIVTGVLYLKLEFFWQRIFIHRRIQDFSELFRQTWDQFCVKMNALIEPHKELLISIFLQTDNQIRIGQQGMNLIIVMLELDERRLGILRRYLPHANVPVNGVYNFGVVVKREDWVRLVEAVNKSHFLLIGHSLFINLSEILYWNTGTMFGLVDGWLREVLGGF